MACRVSYWLDIPVVTPGILQQLQKEVNIAGSNHDLTPSHASRSQGAADAHVPPAVEIGIAKSGQLAIASAPALPEAPGHAAHAELQLAPDLASLDTEPVLLQATAANARIQLGESLQSSLHMQVTALLRTIELLWIMEDKPSSASCLHTAQQLLHNARVPFTSISALPHSWDCPILEMRCVQFSC